MCYLLKKYFWWLLRRVKNLRSTACKHRVHTVSTTENAMLSTDIFISNWFDVCIYALTQCGLMTYGVFVNFGSSKTISWTSADLLSIGPLGTNFTKFFFKIQNFHSSKKMICKYFLQNGGHFVQVSVSQVPMIVRLFLCCFFVGCTWQGAERPSLCHRCCQWIPGHGHRTKGQHIITVTSAYSQWRCDSLALNLSQWCPVH